MQRFVVGTVGWSMVVLALASCSSGSPTQPGTGGKVGTGGSGTGGAASGTGGTTSTGGSSAGTGGSASGGTSSGGTSSGGTSSGGSSSGGASAGSGGSSSGGASAGSGGSSGGNPGTAGSNTGGNAGAAGGRGGSQGSGGSTPNGGAGGSADSGDWVVLFNGKDLTGWTPSPGHTALFAVDSMVGEPAIHVYPTQADQSEQPQATLRTAQAYSSYVYHEEYKWGTKRFAGRKQNARDNGICFHICNSETVVWPDSLEFQIGATPWGGPGTTAGDNLDWVVGNIFMLVRNTRAQWPYKTVSNMQVYSPTGTKKSIGGTVDYEKAQTDKQRNLDSEWNVLELTVHGSKDATYMVNGEVANGMSDMECKVNGTWMPLDKGKLAVQAEFAEVYFRNIKIKILP
jgi:hypothetical protein